MAEQTKDLASLTRAVPCPAQIGNQLHTKDNTMTTEEAIAILDRFAHLVGFDEPDLGYGDLWDWANSLLEAGQALINASPPWRDVTIHGLPPEGERVILLWEGDVYSGVPLPAPPGVPWRDVAWEVPEQTRDLYAVRYWAPMPPLPECASARST